MVPSNPYTYYYGMNTKKVSLGICIQLMVWCFFFGMKMYSFIAIQRVADYTTQEEASFIVQSWLC